MGRPKRADEANCVYHMLNRANRRIAIFEKDADYQAFERVMTEAVERFQIDLFSYCLMPNHWHLCVRPKVDGEMSRFAHWLTLTHTQRYNAHYGTTGEGHLYQGRFKSFLVQSDEHFLRGGKGGGGKGVRNRFGYLGKLICDRYNSYCAKCSSGACPMGRPKRADEANCVYHMLNRANRRIAIFEKDEDYEAFERVMTEAVERFQIDLFSYCLMPNHWHLCVRPKVDGEMSRFAHWLTLTHTQRHNAHYGTTGEGHLYQGRFKSFPVQSDEHFLTVCRYVERNAFTAELCDSPDAWRFGSLYRWKHGSAKEKSLLSVWPIPRHRDWVRVVTMALSDKDLKRLRWSKERGSPFGEETWVESVARRCDLEMTLRPRGRPRKFPIPNETA